VTVVVYIQVAFQKLTALNQRVQRAVRSSIIDISRAMTVELEYQLMSCLSSVAK
jgi:hypothetical protein